MPAPPRLHIAQTDRRVPILPIAAAAFAAAGVPTVPPPDERIYGGLVRAFQQHFQLVSRLSEADVVLCAHDISEHPAAAWEVSEAARTNQKSAFFHSQSDDIRPTSAIHGVVYRSSIQATNRKSYERIATGCVPDLTLERPAHMPEWTAWTERPTLGFMGHVTNGFRSLGYLQRGWQHFHGFRLRDRVLRAFENSDLAVTSFTRRSTNLGPPLAGVAGDELRRAMRDAYVASVFSSTYSLCVRGAGNWSYRFFEALSAGRIPVLIDTDCALPLEEAVPWDQHICRIPFKALSDAPRILAEFHGSLQPEGHAKIQVANRKLWKDLLAPEKFFVDALNQAYSQITR